MKEHCQARGYPKLAPLGKSLKMQIDALKAEKVWADSELASFSLLATEALDVVALTFALFTVKVTWPKAGPSHITSV